MWSPVSYASDFMKGRHMSGEKIRVIVSEKQVYLLIPWHIESLTYVKGRRPDIAESDFLHKKKLKIWVACRVFANDIIHAASERRTFHQRQLSERPWRFTCGIAIAS